jgi:Tfp pilus assembly protein PilF
MLAQMSAQSLREPGAEIRIRFEHPIARASWATASGTLALSGLLWTLATSGLSSAQHPALTFTRDIAPIIWARCSSCHRPGEIGPFNLITYDDVKRHASQIAIVTSRRIMPPWKAEADADGFQGDRRLSDAELQRLQDWIAGGAVEGNPADLPVMPAWEDGWPFGTPDLIVGMPAPYTVAADGPDVFRTFVIPIPLAVARYVRAIEFRPGNARVVHHANLGVDRTQASRQLDLRDPEPGYAGNMGLEARYPEGQLLGWTPGQAPHASPEGMAWRIDPGSDLVAQLHLQPTGRSEPVRVSVGFYFTEKPPLRTPIGLRLGSETIDIAPNQNDYIVRDQYVLPVDVDLFAVQPHAHNLARRMDATATLPDKSVRRLIGIRDWDFRWQDVYRYMRPVSLPKGTTIAMTYVYDNTANNVRNPHRPPVRVLWGQNTTDEMGDLWLQIAARTAADHEVLADDVRRKARSEDLKAYTTLLGRNPTDPLRHDAVASLYFDAGRVDEAIAEYTESLRLDPSSASSHYNLGIALSVRGRRDEAIAAFESALRINPDYAQAHNNLGALLHLMDREEPAIEHYRRAIALRPDIVEAHANLGLLLSARGQVADAVRELRTALDMRPDLAPALAGLAWIRATAADPALRNADEAIGLAERAATQTGRRDVAALDALAAAYAAARRFDEAVATAQAGLEAATAAGAIDVAAQFRQRLQLYQQGRPYQMPRP